MNVYTHVNMQDLANDIESLPSVTAHDSASLPTTTEKATNEPAVPLPVTQSASTSTATSPTIPTDLANLANNWNALPQHIRTAISTLASA